MMMMMMMDINFIYIFQWYINPYHKDIPQHICHGCTTWFTTGCFGSRVQLCWGSPWLCVVTRDWDPSRCHCSGVLGSWQLAIWCRTRRSKLHIFWGGWSSQKCKIVLIDNSLYHYGYINLGTPSIGLMTIPNTQGTKWEFTRDRTYFPFLGMGKKPRQDARACMWCNSWWS